MTSSYLEMMLATAELREPPLIAAIKALGLPKGSKGLDAGCGAGLQSLLLADAVGKQGHVTGLDISPEFLAHGERLVEAAGLFDRISLVEGSIAAIPFDDDSFDWVWSADCVGYGPWDPVPLLEELRRVTKPGGTLAILAWSSERLLPGHPLLEARLSATTAGLAPFSIGMAPERHFQRALGLLRDLGIANPKADAFARAVHAPLSDALYTAIEALFEMRWPGAAQELDRDDRAEYERLCTPGSPDFILKHPDYCAFFTYSMFYGTVA